MRKDTETENFQDRLDTIIGINHDKNIFRTYFQVNKI